MSVASYVMSLLSPRVIDDLELIRFGLTVLPANDLSCPLEDNNYILYHDDVVKTQREFARFSRADAEIYPEFNRYLLEATQVVRRLHTKRPSIEAGATGGPSRKRASLLGATAKLVGRCTGLSICARRASTTI